MTLSKVLGKRADIVGIRPSRRRILTFCQLAYISSKRSTFDPGQSLCTMTAVDR